MLDVIAKIHEARTVYGDKWTSDEPNFQAIKAYHFPILDTFGFNSRGMMDKEISSFEGSTLDDFTESSKCCLWPIPTISRRP